MNCPPTGNVGNVPVGQGAGQFAWTPLAELYAKSTTASSGGITTTETVVAQSLSIPANTLQIGSTIRVRLYGTVRVSSGVNSTWGVRAGSAGTTSDALLLTFLLGLASSTGGDDIPFSVTMDLVVTSIGASGSVSGQIDMRCPKGLGYGSFVETMSVSTSLNTTIANFFSATFVSAGSSLSNTYKAPCTVEIVKI